MPRIEDIAKIWKPWFLTKVDLEVQGYRPGATSVDEIRTDQHIATRVTCPECDHYCTCTHFNKDMKSYRSYIVCHQCDIATRLS